MSEAEKRQEWEASTLEWMRQEWPQEERDLYADWVSRLFGRPLCLEEALRLQGGAYAWHAGWQNARGFYGCAERAG